MVPPLVDLTSQIQFKRGRDFPGKELQGGRKIRGETGNLRAKIGTFQVPEKPPTRPRRRLLGEKNIQVPGKKMLRNFVAFVF